MTKDKVVPLKKGADKEAPVEQGPKTVEQMGLDTSKQIMIECGDKTVQQVILERVCVNQAFIAEVFAAASEAQTRAARAESMLAFIMNRMGTPRIVQVGDKKVQKFVTDFEEWKVIWEQWEQKQIAAAEGAVKNEQGTDGKEQPKPEK